MMFVDPQVLKAKKTGGGGGEEEEAELWGLYWVLYKLPWGPSDADVAFSRWSALLRVSRSLPVSSGLSLQWSEALGDLIKLYWSVLGVQACVPHYSKQK